MERERPELIWVSDSPPVSYERFEVEGSVELHFSDRDIFLDASVSLWSGHDRTDWWGQRIDAPDSKRETDALFQTMAERFRQWTGEDIRTYGLKDMG